jgi:sugar lactone lactonase YvrE
VAFYDGWKVARLDPSGKVEDVIDFPVARVTSCAFGGQDLDELYVTTAIDGLPESDHQRQPLAGDLFMVRPGVRGIPEPAYAG